MKNNRCDKLYHFTKIESFKSMITKKKIWLTSSLEMDDKMDAYYASECFFDYLIKHNNNLFKSGKNISFDLMKKMLKSQRNIPTYTFSFCKMKSNYLWIKFADDYKGVALVFDYQRLNEIIGLIKLDYLNIREIHYTNINDYILEVAKYLMSCFNLDFDNIEFLLKLIFASLSCTIKAPIYKLEKEVRLIYNDLNPCNSIGKALRFDDEETLQKYGFNKLIKKYGNKKSRFEMYLGNLFDSLLLKEVIIGVDCDKEKSEIKKLLKANGFYNTKVRKMNKK